MNPEHSIAKKTYWKSAFRKITSRNITSTYICFYNRFVNIRQTREMFCTCSQI